eukprot:8073808-Alexandrium_andersonii.AAC.1
MKDNTTDLLPQSATWTERNTVSTQCMLITRAFLRKSGPWRAGYRSWKDTNLPEKGSERSGVFFCGVVGPPRPLPKVAEGRRTSK